MKIDHRTGTLILVAVLILAVILVGYVLMKPGTGGAPGAAVLPASSIPPPVLAPQGQLTSGFPSALELDPGAAVSASYAINYSSGTKQYTAEWNSTSSVATIFSRYVAYASAHGWTIQNENLENSAAPGLYAVNGSSTLNVAVTAQTGGTHVVVGYLTPQ